LVARVGDDEVGQRLVTNLEAQNVATTFVTVTENSSTGTASIMVDQATGQNAIVVSPGANALLSPADVDRAAALIRTASVVIIQLEVPIETVVHAIALSHRHRVQVILDPAPAPSGGADAIPLELWNVSVLTPNQTEAGRLLGIPEVAPADAERVARELLTKGPAAVVLKLAEHGSLYADSKGELRSAPAFKVKVKDTTAAGDAFTAALAIARAEGKSPFDTLRFANAAGALATTHPGAQPSLPRRADVDDIIKRWG
jgi:ribokinase